MNTILFREILNKFKNGDIKENDVEHFVNCEIENIMYFTNLKEEHKVNLTLKEYGNNNG